MKTMKTRKTNKTKLFTNCCVALMAFFALGCGSDDSGINNCSNNAWTEIFANEAAAYSNALIAFQNNPSEANCSNVKSTAVDYLEALRDALDCVPTANRAELNDIIDEAQAEVNDEDCD